MKAAVTVAIGIALLCGSGVQGQLSPSRPPIIDMHMHAMPPDFYGPPPAKMCAPQTFPWADPRDPKADFITCAGREVEAGTTDTEVIRRTVEVMKEFNVTGVISAPQRGGATTTLTWSMLLIVVSLVYLSARSAIIGSTRDARRAGIRQATSDTTVMTSVVPTRVAR